MLRSLLFDDMERRSREGDRYLERCEEGEEVEEEEEEEEEEGEEEEEVR